MTLYIVPSSSMLCHVLEKIDCFASAVDRYIDKKNVKISDGKYILDI